LRREQPVCSTPTPDIPPLPLDWPPEDVGISFNRILNKHHAGMPAGAVYIGRGSKWGNPFRIGPDSDRAAVIAKYQRWLADQHQLLGALDELRGRDLVCFCLC
jgi:hypothetical protein